MIDRVCHVLISNPLGGAIIGIAYLNQEMPGIIRVYCAQLSGAKLSTFFAPPAKQKHCAN